jgi:hypothetical protein
MANKQQRQTQPPPYNKRLEGVHNTDELRQLIRDVRSRSAANASGTSASASRQVLKDFDTTDTVVPIAVLRAIQELGMYCDKDVDSTATTTIDYSDRLEECLQHTTLAFTPPPPPPEETAERKKFRQRLERLQWKQEERRYGGLVQNVGNHTNTSTDDITGKSMTYAASIGLNMIIAPLSFGCLMYFFAGGLLSFMGWENEQHHHRHSTTTAPDIRKVIAGVVSGVLMLMIEMILFVIRSHEMDKATRQKAKKQANTTTGGAFGYYTARTARHFKDQ